MGGWDHQNRALWGVAGGGAPALTPTLSARTPAAARWGRASRVKQGTSLWDKVSLGGRPAEGAGLPAWGWAGRRARARGLRGRSPARTAPPRLTQGGVQGVCQPHPGGQGWPRRGFELGIEGKGVVVYIARLDPRPQRRHVCGCRAGDPQVLGAVQVHGDEPGLSGAEVGRVESGKRGGKAGAWAARWCPSLAHPPTTESKRRRTWVI